MHFSICRYKFGAQRLRKKNATNDETRKEGAHTRGAHHRFERKPHFCVGASAGEVAREVAWTRNGSSATSSLRNLLHRKGEARPLVDLATTREKNDILNRIGEKRARERWTIEGTRDRFLRGATAREREEKVDAPDRDARATDIARRDR